MKIREVVIVTGLSGAGKSSALNILEDMDFYTIDNLPLGLEKSLLNIEINKVAVGIDIRTFNKIESFFNFIDYLKKASIKLNIIFLEADVPIILGRYNLSRRAHPLREKTLLESIEKERELLFPIKEISNIVIDTTVLKAIQLEEIIRKNIKLTEKTSNMNIHIQSFGFKYGIPADSDLIFDVRFLPNPYYIKELKEKNGYDLEVQEYVMKSEKSKEFYNKLIDMLEFLLPNYHKEGKKHLTISIGCSGGKHRSVTFVNKLADYLKKDDTYNIYINHREKKSGHWEN